MRSGALPLPVAAAASATALVTAGYAAATSSGCTLPGPPPSAAVRIAVVSGGFTYTGTTCTRFGWGYVAWSKGTAHPDHPTNQKRVLIKAHSQSEAERAAAYYLSAGGQSHFLREFKAEVSRNNPQWRFSVRLEQLHLDGAVLTLQAFSRASLRP